MMLLILICCWAVGCFGQSSSPTDLIQPQDSLSLIEAIEGDLDRDGVPERVAVYNTSDRSDYGTIRELRIYKKTLYGWKPWHSSRTAVLSSEEGGMMGDPFQGVSVEKGILLIHHFGGSSWKWSDTDKYRYQDGDFYLVGQTSYFGKPCHYWAEFDYNLSTGGIHYRKEIEDCEDEETPLIVEEETFVHRPDSLPTLRDTQRGKRKIVTPKHQAEIYW